MNARSPHPARPPGPFTPCRCPEAELLRTVLAGEVPAADTPMWAALLTLVDAAAAHRLRHLGTQLDTDSLIPSPRLGVPLAELERRRHEPRRWVRCPDCGRHWITTDPAAIRDTTVCVPPLACRRCRPAVARQAVAA